MEPSSLEKVHCANASNNKLLQKYWSRPRRYHSFSLLQWLREFDTSKGHPAQYKAGHTLVGTKLVSVFSDTYFFQDMLQNVPHTNTDMILIPGYETFPPAIWYFVCALHHRSELWDDENAMKVYFDVEGHKAWFIGNIMLQIESLKDFYTLWKKRVLTISESKCPHLQEDPLDAKQKLVISLVQKMMNEKKEFYELLIASLAMTIMTVRTMMI